MPIFDQASLRTAIAKALTTANVGADKNAFVAVVTKDAQGHVLVQGVVSTKIGKHWEVGVPFTIDHERHIDGGLEVKATW